MADMTISSGGGDFNLCFNRFSDTEIKDCVDGAYKKKNLKRPTLLLSILKRPAAHIGSSWPMTHVPLRTWRTILPAF